MAVLTLVLAAGGLAATSFLVTEGSQEPPAPESPGVVCQDLGTGQVRAHASDRCLPRTQSEVRAGAEQP